jgi:hypothetical protein
MPRTIDEGFRDFLPRLTPTPGESDAAMKHRASIEACLKANFGLIRFFRTGSFGNGTSISGYSDVDYFASLPHGRLKQNSGVVLTQVRHALYTRFPSTGVRVDCPAVKVPFGILAKESTEVVPAKYIEETAEGYKSYTIPDCSGGWMRSSPDAHNAYVQSIDKNLDGKVKPLIRFIKAWKCYHQVPISSFYLELRVAKYAEAESVIVYDMDVRQIFSRLHNIGLASLQDPMGISGYISASSTQVKLDEAKSKILTAFVRAEKALKAKSKDNIKEAFYWWNLIYDGNFPSYYR